MALDISQSFADHVSTHNKECLHELITKTDEIQNYAVIVNFVILFEENIELGNAILCNSESTLPLCDEGIIKAQTKLFETFSERDKSNCSIKKNVHARITGLPSNLEQQRTVFPRNDDLGNFLKVSGTVVKVTLPKLLEFERDFRCSKCGLSQIVKANYYLYHALQPPLSCANLCLPTSFTVEKDEGGGKYKDYQEVKVQEDAGKLHVGSIPSSIWVTLDNDLVDICHPGDHVTICGTVLRRWRSLTANGTGDVELVVKANNLQVSNDQKSARLITDEAKEKFTEFWRFHKSQPLVGRDLILASFCPDVYGLYLIKLAMCLVLAGGVPLSEDSGSFVRSESHLLLVGDPGTGKSHLLRFAAKVSPRSVLTTGIGSTSAGLTVCAVREGSDWQLEAGALVLADGGICCIDELNSIREQDRTSIHEAMEQQTISVAKAGMVTKLNTRCSILAATNAKGFYDPNESISSNVALASPLLSRFDLILILQDTRSEDWDRLLSSFILELSTQDLSQSPDLWCLETLQSYFALVKQYHPIMSPNANAVLSRYYQAQRTADSRNAARTTVRMLESLVRLAQGHARLMMRQEVSTQDAIIAVSLVECSMASSALVSSANALHAAFPDDPHLQYRRQAELILKKLNLESILQEEIVKINEITPKKDNGDGETGFIQPRIKKSNEHIEFSQRFNDILTGIRKKKDRDMCQVVSLTGKRTAKKIVEKEVKKRKVMPIIEESIENDPCPREIDVKTVEESMQEVSDTSVAVDGDDRTTDDSNIQAAEENNTSRENTVEQSIIATKDIKTPSSKSAIAQKLSRFRFVQREEIAEDEFIRRNNGDMSKVKDFFDDSICGEPLIASTPVVKNIACNETIQVPTPLLTNPCSTNNKPYDLIKLKALAKLGKTLSQSQSSARSDSQLSMSQFSVHEMEWDNIDLEL